MYMLCSYITYTEAAHLQTKSHKVFQAMKHFYRYAGSIQIKYFEKIPIIVEEIEI